MSRQSANSPATSNLPRRAVLKALAAAPTAVAAATGEAFSAPSFQVDCRKDERHLKADRLMHEVNASYDVLVAAGEDELNDAGGSIYDLIFDRWIAAKDALREYAGELSAKPKIDPTDAVVVARIVDFQLVDDVDDNDSVCDTVPSAIRAVLVAHGISPTDSTAASIESARVKAERANEPPAPERVPLTVNAGRVIARLRSLGDAYKSALTIEAGLEEDTPQMEAAIAATNVHHDELNAMCAEILRRRPVSEHSPYDFTQRDEFVVWIELMAADRPDLFQGAFADARCTPVLEAMLARARETGDDLIDHAEYWTASREGRQVDFQRHELT